MESGFTFQPKPEGNHYVAVHLCYRLITDGTASTAALLNCFEFLARSTLANSGWTPDQPIPDDIPIAGDCNNPLLMRLMDGLVKQTALKNKIGLLAEKGFISCDIMGGRRRKVVYHYRRIQNAISDPSLFDGSLSDGSKSDGYPSKSDGSRGQKVTGTRQKVTTTRSSSNSSSNLSQKKEPEVDFLDSPSDSNQPTQGSAHPTSEEKHSPDQQNGIAKDKSSAAPKMISDQKSSCAHPHPAAQMEARFQQRAAAAQVGDGWKLDADRCWPGLSEMDEGRRIFAGGRQPFAFTDEIYLGAKLHLKMTPKFAEGGEPTQTECRNWIGGRLRDLEKGGGQRSHAIGQLITALELAEAEAQKRQQAEAVRTAAIAAPAPAQAPATKNPTRREESGLPGVLRDEKGVTDGISDLWEQLYHIDVNYMPGDRAQMISTRMALRSVLTQIRESGLPDEKIKSHLLTEMGRNPERCKVAVEVLANCMKVMDKAAIAQWLQSEGHDAAYQAITGVTPAPTPPPTPSPAEATPPPTAATSGDWQDLPPELQVAWQRAQDSYQQKSAAIAQQVTSSMTSSMAEESAAIAVEDMSAIPDTLQIGEGEDFSDLLMTLECLQREFRLSDAAIDAECEALFGAVPGGWRGLNQAEQFDRLTGRLRELLCVTS